MRRSLAICGLLLLLVFSPGCFGTHFEGLRAWNLTDESAQVEFRLTCPGIAMHENVTLAPKEVRIYELDRPQGRCLIEAWWGNVTDAHQLSIDEYVSNIGVTLQHDSQGARLLSASMTVS